MQIMTYLPFFGFVNRIRHLTMLLFLDNKMEATKGVRVYAQLVYSFASCNHWLKLVSHWPINIHITILGLLFYHVRTIYCSTILLEQIIFLMCFESHFLSSNMWQVANKKSLRTSLILFGFIRAFAFNVCSCFYLSCIQLTLNWLYLCLI